MRGVRSRDLDYRGAEPSPGRPLPRAGAAVLALLAVLALGMALGRSTAAAPADDEQPAEALGQSTNTLPAEADGQPGEPAAPAQAEVSGIGPTAVEAGVPVGYERSEAGAVAAATHYTVALGGELPLKEKRRRAALEAVATAADAARIEEQLGPGFRAAGSYLDAAVASGERVVLRTIPAGHNVVSLARDEAVVEVWTAGVIAGLSEVIRPVEWSTSTVSLRWERGDWRLEAIETRDGPYPQIAGIDDPVEHALQIAAFKGYWYAPAED